MQIDTNGFELGDVARDTITGFAGTVIGITQWITGCARASLQPKVGKDGKVPDAVGVDVTTLEMVKEGPAHRAQPAGRSAIGGPRPEPGRATDPRR